MGKYLISIVVFLAVIFGGISLVNADDGGPNPVFWIKDNKTTCVSVINPESIQSNAFLVFDYSPNVGEKLGKPWVIIEKGKCYEIDNDGGDIYTVSIVNGNERQQFSDYSKYKSTDNISIIFDAIIESSIIHNETPDWSLDSLDRQPITTSRTDVLRFTGIWANDLFPTKYDFGFPVTSFISRIPEEYQKVVNDKPFIEAEKLYTTLAQQLESAIQLCDTRIRVEYQLTWSNYRSSQKNIIWKLDNGKDFVFDASEKIDPFMAIELMGCKTAFDAYINQHKDDFNAVDQLIEEVIEKYPNAIGRYGPILKRGESFSAPETTNNTVASTSKKQIMPTSLDEPTPEKKVDILIHSSNPLMRIYVLLPIIALVGIIIFFFLRKRQK